MKDQNIKKLIEIDLIEKRNEPVKRKVNLMIEIFKTDFFQNHSLLAQFENDEAWMSENNYFKKLLEYKKKNGFYGDADCDVSLAAILSYSILQDHFLSIENIKFQTNSNRRYEIIDMEGKSYRGDTMTSAYTVIKRFIGHVWKDIDEKSTQRSENEEEFYGITSKVAKRTMNLYNYTELSMEEWYYSNAEVIHNILCEKEPKACEFLQNYTRLGNYIEMPIYVNPSRSNFGKSDTIDTLLLKIYQYYKEKDNGDITKAKERIVELCYKDMNAVNNCFKWLDNFTDWIDFIDKHHLHKATGENKVPISLKTGKEIEDSMFDVYDPLPSSLSEFHVFFETVNEIIEDRTKKLVEELNARVSKMS